jgi:predicted Abi (CAAX) family protease
MKFEVLSKLIIIELFLLFFQFGLGMWNNLFALISLKAPFGFFVYSGGIEVLAHITDGVLILALGFTIIWLSYKARNSLVLKLSVLAVVFIISAIANGILFLVIFLFPALYNIDNYFSLTMALSFLAAFAVLFSELYIIKKVENFKS